MIDLSAVKTYLHITYDDENVDSDVSSILARSEKIIRKYIGLQNDAEMYADEEQLVLDCCRYIYNHAYEDFEPNFRAELTAARDVRAVEAYEAEQAVKNGSQG